MAETIEEVIAELDEVITWCRDNNSRMGYFPALYRKVTIEVQRGILAGKFDDGPRMERLDVLFANRYLEAFHQYQERSWPTESWTYSFASARKNRLIVLQHLLLGMNAHINLDLGIAAARTSPGAELKELRDDFNMINKILSSLVDDVQGELGKVWPGIAMLLRVVRVSDDIVVNFSMRKARDAAWAVAESLAPIPIEKQGPLISKLDRATKRRAEVVTLPGPLSAVALAGIRLRERGSVRDIIDVLS